MTLRRVALIDLPPERQEPLAAILAGMGVAPFPTQWDDLAGPAPDFSIGAFETFMRALPAAVTPDMLDARALPVALVGPMAPTNSELLSFQLEHGVIHLLPLDLWNEPACLERTIRGLLDARDLFEITRFLPVPVVRRRLPVATLAEKHQIAEEVAEIVRPFAQNQRQISNVYLIINELINNAFFHSFRDLSGAEKYTPRHFARLEEPDHVFVEVAAGPSGIALAVEDNRGSLSPQEVLRYMLRQTSGAGIYDSHGRGFYLVSNLVHHLSICLDPDRRTRIITLNHAAASEIRTLDFFIHRPNGSER